MNKISIKSVRAKIQECMDDDIKNLALFNTLCEQLKKYDGKSIDKRVEKVVDGRLEKYSSFVCLRLNNLDKTFTLYYTNQPSFSLQAFKEYNTWTGEAAQKRIEANTALLNDKDRLKLIEHSLNNVLKAQEALRVEREERDNDAMYNIMTLLPERVKL